MFSLGVGLGTGKEVPLATGAPSSPTESSWSYDLAVVELGLRRGMNSGLGLDVGLGLGSGFGSGLGLQLRLGSIGCHFLGPAGSLRRGLSDVVSPGSEPAATRAQQ